MWGSSRCCSSTFKLKQFLRSLTCWSTISPGVLTDSLEYVGLPVSEIYISFRSENFQKIVKRDSSCEVLHFLFSKYFARESDENQHFSKVSFQFCFSITRIWPEIRKTENMKKRDFKTLICLENFSTLNRN